MDLTCYNVSQGYVALTTMLQKFRFLVYQVSVVSILFQLCVGLRNQELTGFLSSVETWPPTTRWQWLLKVNRSQEYSIIIVPLLFSQYLKIFIHSKGSSKDTWPDLSFLWTMPFSQLPILNGNFELWFTLLNP